MARAVAGLVLSLGDTWGMGLWGGVFLDGLGALSVNSVLGEQSGAAGDNSLDWMTPVGWERGRLSVRRRPGARRGDARLWQELTTARSWCWW